MMIKADNIRVWQTINDGEVTIAIDGVLYVMTAEDFKTMLTDHIEKKPLNTLEEHLRLERMEVVRKKAYITKKATP